jgi:hypothetical protein
VAEDSIFGEDLPRATRPTVLARKKGAKVGELAQLTVAYPSLADSIQKAASQYYQGVANSWIGNRGKTIAAWSQR